MNLEQLTLAYREALAREAASFPNGWVYMINPKFDPNGDVPGHAIQGAWKVDAKGRLTGEFRENPNYRSELGEVDHLIVPRPKDGEPYGNKEE